MANFLSKTIHFFAYDIWRIRLRDLPKGKFFLIKQLQIWVVAVRGFIEDNCSLRASALTFYTTLSIVPVAALLFAVAKGFGMDNMLRDQLLVKFHEHEEVVQKVIGFAEKFLQKTQGGLIAGVGVLVLFYTVIKVLSNIEASFNDIWGIKKHRVWFRKFTDYLSLMVVCPILVIVSSSITVFIATKLRDITSQIEFMDKFSPLLFLSIKVMPVVFIWIMFTFVYIFMPNTKVRLIPGIIAGVIAGTLFQVLQYAYIIAQVGLSKYNAIYGSFSALPLFLIWLQFSWLIVLFGAEISFAFQNVESYEFDPDTKNISHRHRILLCLRVVQLIVSRFRDSLPALNDYEISQTLEIPIRLVRTILFELQQAKIVSEVIVNPNDNPGYQPSGNIENLTISDVVAKIESRGSDNIPVLESEELEHIVHSLEFMERASSRSSGNMLMKDI